MIGTIIAMLWMHWVADFMAQTDKMATNKSTSFKWLGIHCLLYGAFFTMWGWKFALIQAMLHFIVDGLSSRWTSHLYQKGDRHNFFVVIGLDQVVHASALIIVAQRMGII